MSCSARASAMRPMFAAWHHARRTAPSGPGHERRSGLSASISISGISRIGSTFPRHSVTAGLLAGPGAAFSGSAGMGDSGGRLPASAPVSPVCHQLANSRPARLHAWPRPHAGDADRGRPINTPTAGHSSRRATRKKTGRPHDGMTRKKNRPTTAR
jgi:hypothetical protein